MTVRNPSLAAPSVAGLQQQVAALTSRLNSMPYGTQAYFDAQRQLADLNNRSWQMATQDSQKAAATSANAGDASMQEAKDKIRQLTEGRMQDVLNDPVMGQATNFFGKVLSGENLPFSQEVQRAQLAQQANGSAQANAAALRALEDSIVASGGSLSDPSFLARKQELMSQRQGQNLDALGRMLSQAQIQNFNAQAQGANSLAGIRAGQNAQANGLGLAGAGYRAQEFRDVPTGGFGDNGGGWTTTTTARLGGGGSFTPFVAPNYGTAMNGNSPVRPPVQQTQQNAGGYSNSLMATNRPQGPAAPTAGAAGVHTLNPGNWGLPLTPKPAVPARPTTFGSPTYRPLGPGQF